jgi:hypothetical protein
LAKAKSATSLLSMAKLGLVAGVFSGIIAWGALRDWNKTLFVAGLAFLIVSVGFLVMNALAKDKEFEKAAQVRNKIYALNHINDISLMNREQSENDIRIEAYDIAHMSGQNMIGVMVVMLNGQFHFMPISLLNGGKNGLKNLICHVAMF